MQHLYLQPVLARQDVHTLSVRNLAMLAGWFSTGALCLLSATLDMRRVISGNSKTIID
jgi:hypothetical protein